MGARGLIQAPRGFLTGAGELTGKKVMKGGNVAGLVRIFTGNRWPGVGGRSGLDAGEEGFDRVYVRA